MGCGEWSVGSGRGCGIGVCRGAYVRGHACVAWAECTRASACACTSVCACVSFERGCAPRTSLLQHPQPRQRRGPLGWLYRRSSSSCAQSRPDPADGKYERWRERLLGDATDVGGERGRGAPLFVIFAISPRSRSHDFTSTETSDRVDTSISSANCGLWSIAVPGNPRVRPRTVLSSPPPARGAG